jgi:hypothetical protein
MGIETGITAGTAAGFGVEAFHVGGERTGALVRRSHRGLLLTTLAFLLPDGHLVHLSQETRFAASVRDWTCYRYMDFSAGVERTGTSGNHPGGAGTEAVPSYAAHLLLGQFLRTGADRGDFSQFVEDGDGTVLASAFVRHGMERIHTPAGPQEAVRVVLDIEGQPRNTFWCDGESVVKSDWQGGTSYATRDMSFALGGLDPRVRSILTEAVAAPARF